MNIIIVNNGTLIGDETTYSELMRILRNRPEAEKAVEIEREEVKLEKQENDKSAEALTARNRVLNKEIEVQKQKIEALRAALQNTAESFGENDRRTQNWRIRLNNAEAALNIMEREGSSNEKVINAMGDEMDDAEGGAEDFADAIEGIGEEAEKAGNKFESFKSVIATAGKAASAAGKAIGTAAAAAGKAIWDMVNETASAGDEIGKISQKIGISAETYQEWSYVFERCGTDVNDLYAGMMTLSTVIADAENGSVSAAEKLVAASLSIEELNELSQEQQLDVVISTLQDMKAGAERTSAAADLLGKSATGMAAVLNTSAEETAALRQEAHDYGMVMSNEAVAASTAFKDSLTRLNNTMVGLKNRMVGKLLPGVSQIMDGLSDLVVGNEQAGEEIKNGVTSITDTVFSLIPQAVQLIGTIAAAMLESAPAIIQLLADGMIGALPQLMPVVLQVITGIIGALVTFLPQIVAAGMQIIEGLVTAILS